MRPRHEQRDPHSGLKFGEGKRNTIRRLRRRRKMTDRMTNPSPNGNEYKPVTTLGVRHRGPRPLVHFAELREWKLRAQIVVRDTSEMVHTVDGGSSALSAQGSEVVVGVEAAAELVGALG